MFSREFFFFFDTRTRPGTLRPGKTTANLQQKTELSAFRALKIC